MTKAEIIGEKIYVALMKIEKNAPIRIPKIIGYLLRKYERYGLADIVEMAWDWIPPERRGKQNG